MSGVKLTPRQRMINMMYLVLIALLALNVSKEVIKAFNLMENSLNNSTKGIADKNMAIKASVEKQAKDGNVGAKAALLHFREAQSITGKLIARIHEIKADLEKRTQGRKAGPDGELVKGGVNELTMGDNMEIHANYFVVENGGKNGKEIQNLINDTRSKLLAVLQDAINDPVLSSDPLTKGFLETRKRDISVKNSLSAEDGIGADGSKTSWVTTYLERSPLAGVFALFSKIENDAKFMETEISQALAESVGADAITVNEVTPVIRAQTSAVLTGQPYEADIILAAYNSRSTMRMTVNGSPIEVNDGIGKFKATSLVPGEYSYEVGINVPQPNGGFKLKTEKGKYTVFAPAAAISADELNVIYVGLDNPLSISVAGVEPGNVSVSVSTSEVQLINKGPGHYFAKLPVRRSNECVVSVSARIGDRMVPMGNKTFRLRNVPRPAFQLGPIDFTQPVKLSQILIQTTASAVIDGFVYASVKYSISSYKFSYNSRSRGYNEIPVKGYLTAPILSALKTLKAGDEISFSDIIAIGPDGTPRALASVSAKLL